MFGFDPMMMQQLFAQQGMPNIMGMPGAAITPMVNPPDISQLQNNPALMSMMSQGGMPDLMGQATGFPMSGLLANGNQMREQQPPQMPMGFPGSTFGGQQEQQPQQAPAGGIRQMGPINPFNFLPMPQMIRR